MAVYKYKALNAEQRFVKGLVEASSIESVTELLSERGLTIISVDSARAGFDIESKIPFLARVKRKSLVIFFRQLSVMLSATVPIVQALSNLSAQTEDRKLKEILKPQMT